MKKTAQSTGAAPTPSEASSTVGGPRPAVAELLERIASVDGLVCRLGEPLAKRCTLRIGGEAEVFVEASSARALGRLMAAVHALELPFLALGHGANVLVPDEGVKGVVVRLGGELAEFEFDSSGVRAGAAVAMARLAREAARRGLGGLEALAGFPSTVGGAVFMNAGCYGTETKDVLVEARLLDAEGREVVLPVAALEARYRHTSLFESGMLVTGARFELIPGDPAALDARIDELNQRRWQSLPSGKPNAGSVFRNPEGDSAGRLLDAAGLRGETVGKARVSERHANVIVNLGGARARDVVELMARCRCRVRDRFGVDLEPELRLLGDLPARFRELSDASDR